MISGSFNGEFQSGYLYFGNGFNDPSEPQTLVIGLGDEERYDSGLNTFYVYGRLCPRRQLEASKLIRYFLANNMNPVDDPQKADLTVIFTCGAFASDEENSILTIERSLENKHSKTIITGCLPKIDPQRLEKYDKTLMVAPENLGDLDSLIRAKILYESVPDVATIAGIHRLYEGNLVQRVMRKIRRGTLPKFSDWNANRKLPEFTTTDLFFAPTTYKIQIAKGCLSNCSFCAIKLAMDKFQSFPEERIVESFRSGLKNGYKDFALVAGDIGCYGLDRNTNLPNLLKKLFALDGDFKVLLWDLNVRWFIDYYSELRPVLEANSKKISKIVLPIESGSDRILTLMNRGYKIESVKERLLDLKTIPDLKIDTHIMVGFPGETNEDFQESVKLVKEIEFSELVVWKYDERPNTRALSLPDKIPRKIIDERARILAKESNSSYTLSF
jgi:threonylcarbamoyladenosine tRNA methylthiotransferase CDKAL1